MPRATSTTPRRPGARAAAEQLADRIMPLRRRRERPRGRLERPASLAQAADRDSRRQHVGQHLLSADRLSRPARAGRPDRVCDHACRMTLGRCEGRPDREHRPVLALCRSGVDLPVSVVVPVLEHRAVDGLASRLDASIRCPSTTTHTQSRRPRDDHGGIAQVHLRVRRACAC